MFLIFFFFFVAPEYISFCDFVGVPIAPNKTRGVSTVLSFAGIKLNTNLCEVRLPREIIETCLAPNSLLLKRKKVILRDIQSLVGLLNFACSVITRGPPFLGRLIDL